MILRNPHRLGKYSDVSIGYIRSPKKNGVYHCLKRISSNSGILNSIETQHKKNIYSHVRLINLAGL